MARAVFDAPVREQYADPAAQVMSLTTSGAVRSFAVPKGASQCMIYPAAALTMGFGPRVRGAYFYDASNALGKRFGNMLGTSGSDLIDRDRATTSGAFLNSMTTGDFIYVCGNEKYSGVNFNVGTANDQASTLTAVYSALDKTFTALTITDKTASGGATLAVDGNIFITTLPAPLDWANQFSLFDLLNEPDAPTLQGFWVGFKVSATLKSTTQIKSGGQNESALALQNRRGVSGRTLHLATTEYVYPIHEEVGSLEFLAVADADTTVRINWYMR